MPFVRSFIRFSFFSLHFWSIVLLLSGYFKSCICIYLGFGSLYAYVVAQFLLLYTRSNVHVHSNPYRGRLRDLFWTAIQQIFKLTYDFCHENFIDLQIKQILEMIN